MAGRAPLYSDSAARRAGSANLRRSSATSVRTHARVRANKTPARAPGVAHGDVGGCVPGVERPVARLRREALCRVGHQVVDAVAQERHRGVGPEISRQLRRRQGARLASALARAACGRLGCEQRTQRAAAGARLREGVHGGGGVRRQLHVRVPPASGSRQTRPPQRAPCCRAGGARARAATHVGQSSSLSSFWHFSHVTCRAAASATRANAPQRRTRRRPSARPRRPDGALPGCAAHP